MNENTAAANLGEQIGVGQHWQPGPVSWLWANAEAPTGEKFHILKIVTTSGSFAIALDQAGMSRFAHQASEESSGLALPQTGNSGFKIK